MFTLIFRTTLTYMMLTLFMRLMGKRQIGELELSEFVVTMLLSEVAAISVSDPSIPFLYSIIAILLLFSFEMLMSFFSMKSLRFKRLLGGTPSILVEHGKIDREELKKARLSLDELLIQLRLKDVTDVSKIEYAILEDNGQLSVILEPGEQPATGNSLGLDRKGGMMHALIIDGTVCETELRLIKKDRVWLENEVEKRGEKIENVYLFSVDPEEKAVFQTKDEKKK